MVRADGAQSIFLPTETPHLSVGDNMKHGRIRHSVTHGTHSKTETRPSPRASRSISRPVRISEINRRPEPPRLLSRTFHLI